MSEIQPTPRQELEALWEKRLEDAKVALDFASNYVKEVQRHLESGSIPSADDHRAYRRALLAETLALDHYRWAVNTLTDLRLTGKIPDEQE